MKIYLKAALVYVLGCVVSFVLSLNMIQHTNKVTKSCMTYRDVVSLSCLTAASWSGAIGAGFYILEYSDFLNKPFDCK